MKTLSCQDSPFSAFVLKAQLAILFCVSYPHTCCALTGHAPGEDLTFHPDQSPFPTLHNVWVLTSQRSSLPICWRNKAAKATCLRAGVCVVLVQELPQASDWLNLNLSPTIDHLSDLGQPLRLRFFICRVQILRNIPYKKCQGQDN